MMIYTAQVTSYTAIGYFTTFKRIPEPSMNATSDISVSYFQTPIPKVVEIVHTQSAQLTHSNDSSPSESSVA